MTTEERPSIEERLDMLGESVQWLADQLDALTSRQTCRRCTEPAPPEPRWPGDLWARDSRGPHTCGRPR
jgi:hypothetical protein